MPHDDFRHADNYFYSDNVVEKVVKVFSDCPSLRILSGRVEFLTPPGVTVSATLVQIFPIAISLNCIGVLFLSSVFLLNAGYLQLMGVLTNAIRCVLITIG